VNGSADGSRLSALGRDVERTSRRVGELDTLVRQLSADVNALARHLGAGSPEAGGEQDETEGLTAVRAWLLARNPDQATADLHDLISWLHLVYLRYPGAALTSCWLWHAGVIEELWWLRCAHAEAYHPRTGTWLRIGDWHDRQRPNVVKRINTALRTCDLELHVAGAEQDQAPAPVPLASAALGIAASWVASGVYAAPPAPTPAQRAEARELFEARHRRRS
jgi:hypothetical protein